MTLCRGRITAVLCAIAILAIALPSAALAQQDAQDQTAPAPTAQGVAQQAAPATTPQSEAGPAQSDTAEPVPAVPATAEPQPAQPEPQPTGAVATQMQAAGKQADSWKVELDNIMLALGREGVREERLGELRADAERIIEKARALEATIQPEIAAIQTRLKQLGAAPTEGEAPETKDIADRRKEETAILTAADSALKKVRLAIVQSEQVVREISTLRRGRVAQALSVRDGSILNPALWIDGFRDTPDVARGFAYLVGDSWNVASSRITPHSVLILLAAVAVAVLIGVFVRRFMRRFAPPVGATEEEVPRLRKLLRAIMVTLTDGILPVIAIGTIYLAIELTNLRTPRIVELNNSLFTAIAAFSFLFGLARGIFAPLRPGWRLIGLTDTAAAQTIAAVTAVGAILAVSAYLETVNQVLVAPVSVEVIKRAITALLIAVVYGTGLLRLSTGWQEPGPNDPQQTTIVWSWLRSIIWAIVFAITGALIAGYIALANFLAVQLVLASVIIAVIWLLLGLIEELTNLLLSPTSRFASTISRTFGISESGVTQLSLVASGLLRMILVALGAIMVLLPWGLDTGQWRQWIQKAFFGFSIGGVTISLSSILGALILFAVGLVITRAVQSWLANRFLPYTHLDLGMRNSIRTVVGYTGVVVAAIFSVTYLGFNLEKIALLAGALSLGIGFGLQSIVNNFVSGLILLAERPIKEGDWIVVGTEQGYVRDISIRSTSIETFDRSTVIIPNSDLITGTVKNWMHTNNMGRVIIPVGVSYSADPEQVRDILLDIARKHPDVLAYPEPRVYFMDFANSSLAFNLYAYLTDVNNSLTVRSDFHFEILKRFREADIEIPFPQNDIHLRDIDRLEGALAGLSRASGKTNE